MARQTELLNQLVQAQMGHFQQQPRGRGEPLSASYQDFLSTQPPLFHKAGEPLQPSNSGALLVFGGISFMRCNLPITSLPGTSFELRFEHITYQRDSLSGSSMNF
jgi:hypothetical protein